MPTILIIDDEPAIRSALSKLLKQEGYRLLLAADAYAAMSMAKRDQPNLILLDVMIPPMDGLTFLMLLRQEPGQQEVPVILLTGLSDANTAARAKDLGVKAHLVKGEYTPQQLLDLVRQHLRPQ